MRFKLFLICIISSETVFSQENLGLEYCNHLKFENYINKKAKFDSSFVKPFMDSIKNYFIKNNNLIFPEICEKNGNFLVDLNDLMQCYIGDKLEYGSILHDYYIIDENLDKDSIFQNFSNNMRDDLLNFEFPYKIYSEFFDMKMDIEYFFADPINMLSYTYIENKDIRVVLFMLYF
jgi:hypothetical protein